MLASGELTLPAVGPGESCQVDLDSRLLEPAQSRKGVFLTIKLRLRSSQLWAESGHEVAWHQHQLSLPQPHPVNETVPELVSGLSINSTRSTVTVSGQGFSFVFDSARGYLTSWSKDGHSLLESDPITGAAVRPAFWRPPIDNDQPISLPYWRRFGVDALTSQLRGLTIAQSSNNDAKHQTVALIATTFLSPPVLDWGWTSKTTYTICTSGSLTVEVELRPSGAAPVHVPRVGLDLRLPRRLDAVSWLGLGPGESYPDKRSAQKMGIWTVESVAELHTPYEVPQEGGNRMGTRWVAVTDAQGGGLRVTGRGMEEDGAFSFKAGRYADRMVQEAKHPVDLVEEDATLLRLDARVAGVGTAACGPGVREDFLVKTTAMEFSFKIEPVGV